VAKVVGTLSKEDFNIGDMVEFTFNKEKVIGKVEKVNEKTVKVLFHKVFRAVNADVSQNIDMTKVLVNLTADSKKVAAIAA